jgi:hypothetical protein
VVGHHSYPGDTHDRLRAMVVGSLKKHVHMCLSRRDDNAMVERTGGQALLCIVHEVEAVPEPDLILHEDKSWVMCPYTRLQWYRLV